MGCCVMFTRFVHLGGFGVLWGHAGAEGDGEGENDAEDDEAAAAGAAAAGEKFGEEHAAGKSFEERGLFLLIFGEAADMAAQLCQLCCMG